ncbi:MAG: hypothetical protein K0R94_1708 [Burkholderiales bacterium]|jgi:hypothetical protein|nr:hypothetical protein [Burkholderiales bacterium]
MKKFKYIALFLVCNITASSWALVAYCPTERRGSEEKRCCYDKEKKDSTWYGVSKSIKNGWMKIAKCPTSTAGPSDECEKNADFGNFHCDDPVIYDKDPLHDE